MLKQAQFLALLVLAMTFAANTSHALSWSALPDLPQARSRTTAVYWYHHVYVIGGQDSGIHCSARVDAYNLVSKTWKRKSDAPEALCAHAAVPLKQKIYIFGGSDGARGTDRTLIYDPKLDRWTAATPMPSHRKSHAAAPGKDGRIYVFGGFDTGPALATMDVYDPATDTWQSAPAMPEPRSSLAAATGCGDKIYAIGGHGPSSRPYGTTPATLFAYDSDSQTWSVLPDMPQPRADLAATQGGDGRIYALGGLWDKFETSDVQIYDPSSKTWSTGPPMPTARYDLAALRFGNRIFAVGGGSKFGGQLAAHEVLEQIPGGDPCPDHSPGNGVAHVHHSNPGGSHTVHNLGFPGLPTCHDSLRNGSFEEPAIAAGRRYDNRLSSSAVPGWTLSQGSAMELQRDVFGPDTAKEGEQYLEIASTGATTIIQEVAVKKGATYELRGFYAPRPWTVSNEIGISVWSGAGNVRKDLAASGKGWKRGSLDWQEFKVRAVASSDRLSIAFRDQSTPDGAGGFLDGIRLCRID